VCMATGGTSAVAGSYADLVGMVSMAVQTVPYSLLFPLPLLKSPLLPPKGPELF
jgi:hypothetical protein